MIRGESWGLVWEWGALASVVSGAPSASLAKSGASALPGLGALLGTLPVVGLRDTAVLVVRVSSSIFGPDKNFPHGGIFHITELRVALGVSRSAKMAKFNNLRQGLRALGFEPKKEEIKGYNISRDPPMTPRSKFWSIGKIRKFFVKH